LIQLCPRLSLNTLGPFLCFHQCDYTIPLDCGSSLEQWSIVATIWYVSKGLIIWNLFRDLDPLIIDTYHHVFSCWIGLNVLSSSKQGFHNFFSLDCSYYHVHHISQHVSMIVVQLLGLSRDGLNYDGVLLQEIGPHLNLHHPQCYNFTIVARFIVFLTYLCNFSIFPFLQC
jgi:hypothetical protein